MADGIQVEAVNFFELQRAFDQAPDLALRYTKSEMLRFGKRFRKKFIRERMSGSPGIKWDQGKRKIGANLRAETLGSQLEDLKFRTRISRMLRTHEEGHTWTPKTSAGWLFLSRKTGNKNEGHIFARVKSITVPPRLHFVKTAQHEIREDLVPRIHNAMGRAVRVAMERNMRNFQQVLGMALNG